MGHAKELEGLCLASAEVADDPLFCLLAAVSSESGQGLRVELRYEPAALVATAKYFVPGSDFVTPCRLWQDAPCSAEYRDREPA